jgi:putative flavoprotein involved in K+ transport
MPRTDTVIIGAGHAGLAMSRCLLDRGVEHVVLERGRIGERWRTARWDSFRLLTPNWLSRLPGWTYTGPEPDGFMTAPQFADHLCGYALSFDAPVRPRTHVVRVERLGSEFAVHTDREVWAARNVVVATGYHSRVRIPPHAARLATTLAQVTSSDYRSPSSLPDGGVLVVGASASGTQIAADLARAGCAVHLAVGRHTRLPRRYRGRDILWWLDRTGSFERTVDQTLDPVTARDEPSLQLTGSPEPRGVDLGILRDAGVRLAGRLLGFDGTVAAFAGDLAGTVDSAQHQLDRILGEIDRYAAADPATAATAPDPPPAITLPPGPSHVDTRRAGISAVVWATGYRPRYPWLAVPVLDRDGRIQHRRGVTGVPGLYAIGLRFQHRRNSTFIDGARHDAAYLAEHITAGRPTLARR